MAPSSAFRSQLRSHLLRETFADLLAQTIQLPLCSPPPLPLQFMPSQHPVLSSSLGSSLAGRVSFCLFVELDGSATKTEPLPCLSGLSLHPQCLQEAEHLADNESTVLPPRPLHTGCHLPGARSASRELHWTQPSGRHAGGTDRNLPLATILPDEIYNEKLLTVA